MANLYKTTFKKYLNAFKLLIAFCFLGTSAFCQSQVVNFSTSGNFQWTAPCGVSSIAVYVWAGGGGGAGANVNYPTGGGGGGGAFIWHGSLPVSPQVTYNLTVGAGGTGGENGNGINGNGLDGSNSSFGTGLVAGGGKGGKRNPIAEGGERGYVITNSYGLNAWGTLGGAAADGTPTYGGGGGSTGSPLFNGPVNATTFSGGLAISGNPYNGGNGGNGRNLANGDGSNGTGPGGGGGGALRINNSNYKGGDGGNGRVIIVYEGPPSNYCLPEFNGEIHPITSVDFGGFTNSSSESIISSNPQNFSLQTFCTPQANVTKGQTYPITVQGNTDGNVTDHFFTFIDWNQNGVFTDVGEVYDIGQITNSTGIDGKTAVLNISVPNTAGILLGKTMMRVMKRYYFNPINPCSTSYGFGEAEDYVVNVFGPCQQPTGATVNGTSTTLTICSGTSVTFRQTGGALSGGQVWVWSKASCTGADENTNTNSDAAYTITPTGPGITEFYVKARGGSCGPPAVGPCQKVTLIVVDKGTISVNSGTSDFSACRSVSNSNYVSFNIGGGATNATVSGLPTGITGTYAAGILTIGGTTTAVIGSYTYTVSLTGNSSCVNLTLTGVVTVTDKPSLIYAGGTFTYCIGGTITNNVPTITYGNLPAPAFSISPSLPTGLSFNTSNGNISGTPSGTVNAVTTYTITSTNNGCASMVPATVNIAISAGNTVFPIEPSGNQTVCSSSTGLVIGIPNSVSGINYQLYRNAVAIGTTLPGNTGSRVDFPAQLTPGTYTIVALTGCLTNMNGSVNLSITPQPNTSFTYAPLYCKAAANPLPTINGPAGGIFSSSNPGIVIANPATGEINITASTVGTYNNVITYSLPAAGGCNAYSYQYNSSLEIAYSPNVYDISGGGPYCSGGTGVPIGLSASQIGVNYQLYADGVPVGAPIPGLLSGAAISFGLQTTPGTYTVRALLGSCNKDMDGEVEVFINSTPAAIAISPASLTLCQGTIQPLTATLSPAVNINDFQEVTSGTINQTIPNNSNSGTFYRFRMTGIPAGVTITAVRLEYYLTHDRDLDLIINLKGSNGKVLNIASGLSGANFGSSAANPTKVDNISTTSITTGTMPYTAVAYAPQGAGAAVGATSVIANVSNTTLFSGLYNSASASANGNWFLSVKDNNATGGDGNLRYCKLRIEYTSVNNPTSVTWAPVTDLYTDPAGTIPYTTADIAAVVYVKPSSSGTLTYTANNSNTSGCNTTATTILTVNPSPTITVTADYCNTGGTPGTVRINANSNISISNWLWSTGSTVGAPLISFIEVNTAGNYFVSAKAGGVCPGTGVMSIAQELVTNGDFELGNVGFISDYAYKSDIAFVNNELVPDQGYDGYGVGEDGQFYHNNFWGLDHTYGTGTGKYMLVNGHDSLLVVWKNENVTVLPNTTYYFSAYGRSLNAAGPFAALRFKVNGVKVGTTGILPPGTNSNNNSTWTKFYGTWNSGAATSADIFIVDTVAAAGGNDFGLDDISFGTLSTFFTVNPSSGNLVQNGICAGAPIDDIVFEVGGDGNVPVLISGSFPPGLTSYWNGRMFRISGSPTTAANYDFTYSSTGCNPKTQNIKLSVIPASDAGIIAGGFSTISDCYNSAGSIALTGTIGTFQWQTSNNPTGGPWVNVANGSYSSLISAKYYRVIAQNTNACLMDSSAIVKLAVKNLWTGKTNDNWGLGTNWSDDVVASTAPCFNVVIPVLTGKPYPILTGSASVGVAGNLIIESGASLQILNDAILKIAGTITSAAGTITANTGTVEMNGIADQPLSGRPFVGNNIKKLIISGTKTSVSVTVADSVNILSKLSLENNADLETGDNINLKSTPSETAAVGVLQSGNIITGKFTIERFINYYQNWNLLSSPINKLQPVYVYGTWQENGTPKVSNGKGTQITSPVVGPGIDGPSIGQSLKYYNATSGTYTLIDNTMIAPVNINEGYYIFIRGDRGYGPNSVGSTTTLRSKGDIYSFSIKPAYSYTVAPGSFISIGNPYASAVDLRLLAANNPNIEENFYFWDPTLSGSYGVGGYQNVSALTGYTPTPSSTLYLNTKKYTKMQSGQAIFAITAPTAPNLVTINFNENMKADSSLLVTRGNNDEPNEINMLSTMIYNSGGNIADGNRVVFSSTYANEVDKYDALKISNAGVNFGLLRNQKKLIVEGRQPIHVADTLHYNMSNLNNGSYKLGFSVQNIPAGNEAFLIDKFFQTSTPVSLADSSFYSFTTTAVAASKAADRFMLVFKSAAGPLPVTITGISASRNNDRSIAIRWTVENEVNIEKYEVERSADGRNFTGIISAAPTNSNAYTKNDLSPLAADNFYRIKAITVGGYTQYSSIVKVAPLQELAAITVFPNPVVDQRTQIRFINQTAGTYELKLFNQSGQLMQKEQVKVVGNSFVKTFVLLNNNFAGGVYQLSILTPDGTSTIQQLIIK